MAALDLRFEVDSDQRTFVPGDTISGELVVNASKKTKCKGLSLTLGWETHGHGNVDEGVAEETLLFEGEYSANSEHRYPFSFELPAGPYTYNGHYLNVAWSLHAEADVPWAFDPEATWDLVLEPGDNPPRSRQLRGQMKDMDELMSMADTLRMGAGGFLATIGALSLLYAFATGFEIGPALMIGVALLFFGGTMAFGSIRKKLAEKKLGEVTVSIEPEVLAPGDEFVCKIQFQPQSEAKVLDITAEINGSEVVTSGSGTSRTTYTHELHSEVIHIQKEELRTFRPGLPVELELHGEVPHDAPFSFNASDNSLKWSLELHIDIARSPDWKETHPLFVAPCGLSDSAE